MEKIEQKLHTALSLLIDVLDEIENIKKPEVKKPIPVETSKKVEVQKKVDTVFLNSLDNYGQLTYLLKQKNTILDPPLFNAVLASYSAIYDRHVQRTEAVNTASRNHKNVPTTLIRKWVSEWEKFAGIKP